MALQTQYYNAGTSSAEWKCRLIVTENSVNTSNNSSNVTLTLQFTRSNSGGYQAWCGYATSATMSIAGQSKNVTVAAFNYTSVGVDDWKTIATATFDVKHNTDGSLSATAKGYWNQSYCTPNTCNVSGTITLTKINMNVPIGSVTPQTYTVYPPSSITATDTVAGNNCYITITKNTTTTLTHGLRYKTNKMTYPTNITTSPISATSYTWSIPKRLTSDSGVSTCTIYLDTYWNGLIIGTTETMINLSRPSYTTSNPIDLTSSGPVINTSLDVNAVFDSYVLRESGTDVASIYAALSHSHVTSSGGSLDASDSGGCWIQFSNGFQICWNRRSQSSRDMTTVSANATYGGHGISYTFPKAFADTPIVKTNVSSNGYSNSQSAQITTTSFTLRHWTNYYTTLTSLTFQYIAIGRWK